LRRTFAAAVEIQFDEPAPFSADSGGVRVDTLFHCSKRVYYTRKSGIDSAQTGMNDTKNLEGPCRCSKTRHSPKNVNEEEE
jgi:hypothetical protein